MHRLATFLLLLPLVLSSSNRFELDHLFSKKVKPCQDFHKFVCNPHGNGNESFAYQVQEKFNKKLTDAASSYSDPLFDYILEAYYKDERDEALLEKGIKIGENASKFKGDIIIKETLEQKIVEINDLKVLANANDLREILCVYKECPIYVRAMADSYMTHTYDEYMKYIDLANWEIHVNYVQPKPIENTPALRKKSISDLFSGRWKSWNPYLNLISSTISIEKSMWLPKELEEKLNEIGDVLVEETVAQIQKQAWIPEDRKNKAIQFMKNMTVHLAMSDAAKNFRNIKKILRFYTAEFNKNKENLLGLLANQSCSFDCHATAITDVIHQATDNYVEKYGNDSIYNIHGTEAMFNFNAFNWRDRVAIPPASQFYVTDDLPVGLRWGQIAAQLGHELFHSLDPIDIVEEIDGKDLRKASNYLVGLSEYDEAAKCYEDYYGSLKAKAPDGTIHHPRGDVKYGEGFADVEGMRTILRVVQKTLFSDRAFKASYSYSAYHDLEWFFIGSMISVCADANKDDYELFEELKYYPHPRPTVRMNAVMRQLDEFSRLFHCKPGDPMYVVEKQCKAFPNE